VVPMTVWRDRVDCRELVLLGDLAGDFSNGEFAGLIVSVAPGPASLLLRPNGELVIFNRPVAEAAGW